MADFGTLHSHRKPAHARANTDTHADAHIHHYTRAISHPYGIANTDHYGDADGHTNPRAFRYTLQDIHPRANLDGFTDQTHQHARANPDDYQIKNNPGSSYR